MLEANMLTKLYAGRPCAKSASSSVPARGGAYAAALCAAYLGIAAFYKIAILETGPISNHVTLIENSKGKFAYVTVGGLRSKSAHCTPEIYRAESGVLAMELASMSSWKTETLRKPSTRRQTK